jgi:hypothetical protein
LRPADRLDETAVKEETVSVSVTVLTTRLKLPTTEALQRALGKHGFEVKLDPACDLATHKGFWPATYQGRIAGFELQRGTPDEILAGYPCVSGKFDVALTFISHSSMDEGCSAWLSAAALTELAQGVLLDESTGDHVAAADAVAWGRDLEKEALA